MTTRSTPCIGLCTIGGPGALCLGCGRTLDEIARWGAMSEEQRLAVMALLPGRAADARPGAAARGEGDGPWTGTS